MNRSRLCRALGVVLISSWLLVACRGRDGYPLTTIATNGDRLAFNSARMSVPTDHNITIAFSNKSTSQWHNWVLVTGGDAAAQAVDDAAVGAPNNLPDNPNIVAHTDTIPGGAISMTSVMLPAGTYIYLCTVPGHYDAGMKGILTVQ